MTPLLSILMFCFVLTIVILAIIFLIVPLLRGIGVLIGGLFKGIGFLVGGLFKGIGWVIMHIFEFVSGMLRDVVRFVGTILAVVLLTPLSLVNVIIGRWSAAGHYADSVKREVGVASACLYRVCLRRPLKLVLLHGLLEGLEQRVPEAMEAAPGADRPSRRTGQFDGYTIVGSLRGGGSGAKLYIAEPSPAKQAKITNMPQRVVIKCFAVSEGSSIPQIVRESRALEAAKQLGLVLDHDMDEQRFFYVMPYHAGEDLGIITRQLHGESDGRGLGHRQLALVMGYVGDLLTTLSKYHHAGLWHKDVKPENVIVRDGQAHLVDLGLVTPLRSAMTLTTHGTEYFRDPEMVRMALRGVKVHQVDGAKFDIYAVGAVLYFMIENTFPAHGGLSNFNKRSPDSVRWIVRRAMADYNQRYETADAMLADLRCIAGALDPFTVKPGVLPSMRGAESAVEAPLVETLRPVEAAAPVAVAKAGSPQPPHVESPEIPEIPDPPEPPGLGPQPEPAVGAALDAPPRRPKLHVVNWWTGAYRVRDDGTGARPHVQRARPQAKPAAAAYAVMGGRKAAREQLRSARHRVREIRRRTQNARHRAVAERQPSPVLVFLTMIVLVGGAFAFYNLTRRIEPSPMTTIIEDPGPLGATALARVSTSVEPDLRLLLINDHSRKTDPRVKEEVEKIMQTYRLSGWQVMRDEDAEIAVRKYLPHGPHDHKAPLPILLQTALDDYELGGVLYIVQGEGDGKPHDHVAVAARFLENESKSR
ncbi:MAG: protein kinase domain-containing protein [Planctomycetota bacterium]|jgi:serine/threonine protein kinase